MIRPALLITALVLALGLVAGAEIGRTALGSNFHTVVPKRCYRCSQPTPDDLDLLARRFGVRSVINLRGFDERPWYQEERDTAERLGILFVDAGMWASSQPTVEEFQHVVTAVDESPEPILIHCDGGSDRSGLASAIFLLLKTDASLPQASGQLSLRFGHLPGGRAACLDRILASYMAWLEQGDLQHRPEYFRRWTAEMYRPANP